MREWDEIPPPTESNGGNTPGIAGYSGICCRIRPQLQEEQSEDEQLLQLEEPRELTDLPPLEKPKREKFFRTFLLLHFSHGGNGELELGSNASKVWLHFWH